MATVSLSYSANTAITLDPSSLSQSSTFITGIESAEIDNTSNLYEDAIVTIDGITAGGSTNTVGQEIRVYVWGSDTSLGTKAIDALDGTSSSETMTATTLQALRLAASVQAVVTTASLVYYIPTFSVAQFFGGVMPKFWGLFFSTSFSGGIAASMSGKFQYTGIKHTIA